MKLTKSQERAKWKLTREWQTPYDLKESIPTLDGLLNRGIAERRFATMGVGFSPRNSIYYRLKFNPQEE